MANGATTTKVTSTTSRQAKAGVTLSVARVTKMLRCGPSVHSISSRAPVYVAAAIEHMLSTLMKQATENVRSRHRLKSGGLKMKRVTNADIIEVVRTDPDLARLFSGFAFSSHSPANKPIKFILSAEGVTKRRDAKQKRKNDKCDAEKAKAVAIED